MTGPSGPGSHGGTAETGVGPTAPVAVIVVSWNSRGYLEDCLSSLGALEHPPAEIVVVDNASDDGSAELVRQRFPGVVLVALPENSGFCRANNLGIRSTRSPFVLVLNPDTRLTSSFLEELLPAFADPQVGAAAGKLLRFDGVTLDSAGQQLGRSRRPIDRGYGRRDRGQYERDEEVFGVCGAAAVYRRQMLDSIALEDGTFFDERFFAFYEDLDVAWRARRRGWRIVYRPRALGYHARGGSAARRVKRVALLARSAEVRFHVLKNRYLTILRNDTLGSYLANLPFIWARDLALLGLVLVTSPGVLPRLWRARRVFRDTLRQRRLDSARAGHHVPRGGS